MVTQRVGDMTVDELKAMIARMIDEQINRRAIRNDDQSSHDVLAAMRETIFEPLVDGPSAVDMLLEDRAQWNNG
ncbi:MAG: hypothetical protein JW966_01300 [Anaerolineae bacterium]|nr:hypothetical protein [Anaerolineae bacterium]